MGITELAANTFRTTQTAERIKSKGLSAADSIVNAAKQVGEEVRAIVIGNTQQNPEDLKIEDDVTKITKELKVAKKVMLQHDGIKK